jgi:hypothetical protein
VSARQKANSRASDAGISIAKVKRMAIKMLKETRGELFSIEVILGEADSTIDVLGSELRDALMKWEAGVVDVLEYLGEPSGSTDG